MTRDTDDLTGLIGSRICHDLISPIGAIGNGLELLEMRIGTSEELALVSESCRNANARIRFFRIAFGAAGAGQTIPGQDIAAILAEMERWSRFTYHWAPVEALDRREARLACLAILCVESALPAGGRVTATLSGGRWSISGTGRRVAPDPHWSALTAGGADTPMDAAAVQVPMILRCADNLGKKLHPVQTETGVAITF